MFVLTLVLPLITMADTVPSYCSGNDIHIVSAELYPGQKNSPTFEYRYQEVVTDKSQPVVIFLPGGPGITSISATPKGPFQPLPTSLANVVYTDQRGTGCNPLNGENNPPDNYKTKYFANDVLGIIRDLKAQGISRYVIYGHSFGTYHATLTAALIETKKAGGEAIDLPESVVLEGIIGRAFAAGDNLKAYQTEWNKVKARLSQPTLAALAKNDLMGLPADSWGSYILKGLYLGRMPIATHIPDLQAEINGLSLPPTDPQYQALKAGVETSTFNGFNVGFKTIDCTELTQDFYSRPLLENGDFTTDGNLCSGLTLTDPYDSKNYQLSVPIIYFTGTNDAAAPLAQARYHFENQTSKTKSFVTLGEAGHLSLQVSLYGCKGGIWDAILRNKQVTSGDLKTCPWAWPISVEH